MAGRNSLAGRSILLVEDDYLIAADLAEALQALGADVVGPVGRVADALALIEATPAIDGAIMNVNLGDETSFGIADALAERGIRFALVSGYGKDFIPPRFQNVALFEKPLDVDRDLVRLFG